MTIIKRADLGRPLTWDELDDNFQQVDDLTAAASAAVSSASASATAAASSAASSATSATDAANSAANAAAAIVSAVKSTVTFTTGGTLNSNLDRISDGTYLYYWTGSYPITVPASSTVDGTGGIGIGFWAVDTDLLLRPVSVKILGEYTSGNYTLRYLTDRVVYGGLEYSVADESLLPFTTTGVWADDVVNLVVIGGPSKSVHVKFFGAPGDGTDQTAQIQLAADFTKGTNLELEFESGGEYLINSDQIKLPYVDGYLSGKRMVIRGNGCTFITSGAYEPFIQYTGLNVTTTSVIKYGYHFHDFTVTGFANRDSTWTNVVSAMAISFAYGAAYNIHGENLGKVMRMYGRATSYRTSGGSQIRDSVISCYTDPKDNVTGHNAIFQTDVDWCSGDAIISKGPDVYIDGLTYNYVGCIQATNEDDIYKKANVSPYVGEPRGVPISAGADSVAASNITILNVKGNYVGAGGLSINASNVSIGGVIDLGSIWTDNFAASLTGAMVWLNVQGGQIGNIKCKDIYSGLGLNAGCSDLQIGKFTARSKMAVTGATLFSATDSSESAIERVDLLGVYLHGASTINNDVYLNTAGITIGEIYISQMNNQQGGVSVEFARACRVRKLTLVATTSTATNTWVRFSAAASVDRISTVNGYGTAILVASDIVPVIGDIRMSGKLGSASPIVINGTGTQSLKWGNITIGGNTTGQPSISGTLSMEGYTGNSWKLTTTGVTGVVSYPTKVTQTLS